MTTINSPTGFQMNPSQKIENMKERFASSDIDANGVVSKEEFLANAPENATTTKLDKIFAKMDADGNGEVTAEEHQTMIDEISERMQSMSRPDKPSSYVSGDTLKNMLESLADNEDDPDKSLALDEMLNKLEGNNVDRQARASTMAAINNMYPKVDISA